MRNPVWVGIVAIPDAWYWSSCKAVLGHVPRSGWLAVDDLLAHSGQRRTAARRRYRHFVMEGIGQ